MTTQLTATAEDPRVIEIEGDNRLSPGSVFIASGGFCIELDRAAFLAAVRAEFGLIDPLEELLSH